MVMHPLHPYVTIYGRDANSAWGVIDGHTLYHEFLIVLLFILQHALLSIPHGC